MREVVIKAVGLRKTYGDFVAVDNLDLEIYKGEIFGILGPNGAGKTTTISMLMGLIPPTSGDAFVDGHSVKREPLEVRRRVGFLAENPGFYEGMSAWENLMLTAKLNRVEDAEEKIRKLIEKVGLYDWLFEPLAKFSKGMKQRLGIADALLKEPSVLILDEPTSGIDPKGAEEILTTIETLARENGITVLMSSHLLHQVERICDRVAIMNRGKIISQGGLNELLGEKIIVEFEVEELPERVIDEIRGLGEVEAHDKRVRVSAERDVRGEIARILYENGVKVLGLNVTRPGLYEIYKHLLEGEVS